MVSKSDIYSASYFRNFIFGVEDSLVSTVGLLSGIAIAGIETRTIFITGFILIFVEAFSMAIGSFLSEYSAEEYLRHTKASIRHPILDGTVMFVSYFISGFIPLFPYFVWSQTKALWFSVGLSLVALFLLGVIGANISRINTTKGGMRMFAIGGVAIAVGIMAGRIANGL